MDSACASSNPTDRYLFFPAADLYLLSTHTACFFCRRFKTAAARQDDLHRRVGLLDRVNDPPLSTRGINIFSNTRPVDPPRLGSMGCGVSCNQPSRQTPGVEQAGERIKEGVDTGKRKEIPDG
jgi:hypothetical protein